MYSQRITHLTLIPDSDCNHQLQRFECPLDFFSSWKGSHPRSMVPRFLLFISLVICISKEKELSSEEYRKMNEETLSCMFQKMCLSYPIAQDWNAQLFITELKPKCFIFHNLHRMNTMVSEIYTCNNYTICILERE